MSLMRHFDRLGSLRHQLEDHLLLQETRNCFDDEESDDGTINDLKGRISELTAEMSA